jgi:hypothetical protein
MIENTVEFKISYHPMFIALLAAATNLRFILILNSFSKIAVHSKSAMMVLVRAPLDIESSEMRNLQI